jgi:dual specificity tyrosine-phosphorylation-regulated kinase 2/3/4
MKTLQERLNEDGKSTAFCDFISKILVWEPEKRLKPEDALQEPWIVEGIPKEVKECYTFFTSREKSKDSKNKKSRSKSKSLGKK